MALTPAEIAAELTDMYRTPTGTMALRPVQGSILLGGSISGGAFSNAAVGLGKAQPVDEPVLTPDGWKNIGSLRVGDLVIGSAGVPVNVLAVHPQGLRAVMRVTFTDRSWTRCDLEHLWTFRRPGCKRYADAVFCNPKRTGAQLDVLGSKWETRTLCDWVTEVGLSRRAGEGRAHNLFLPMVAPIERTDVVLPLDPYTLGALLGDGGMTQTTVSFTGMDRDIVDALVLPSGVFLKETKHQSGGLALQYNLTTGVAHGGRGHRNPLKDVLVSLGLHGCSSANKFIPSQYLRGSVQQRLALLQGLLDTDGSTANDGGLVEYSTLSPLLAAGAIELVEGLGGTACRGANSANGNARIQIKLPRHLPAFRCRRKGESYAAGDRQREPYRALEKVEPDGTEECVCITVDAWDSLYVTRHHILTHNSLALALAMAILGGKRPMIVTEASNIPQLRHDFEEYRKHWQIPSVYRIDSYESISTRPELLDEVRPTFLGLDEAHRVKAPPATRGKRFNRWRIANPDVPVLALSGSPGEAFEDYAHLMCWAVPALRADRGGPIPIDPVEQIPTGAAFREFCARLRKDETFHERVWGIIRSTPGVVISAETYTDTPLHVSHEIMPTPPEMAQHWERLRCVGEAPDGWLLEGPGEQWGVARCMAGGGFYYEHVPRPPEPYRAARKAWYRFAQDVIDTGERAPGGPYDTEGQVVRAALAGRLPRGVLDAWRAQQPTYTPTVRPCWLTGAALEYAIAWGRAHAPPRTARNGGAIIWTEHVGFGVELAKRTGWPYFGDGARDATSRRHVSEICRPVTTRNPLDPVIICSTDSCSTGKNLQHRYNQGLWMNPPSNLKSSEQQLGRKHRSGQPCPAVHATFAYGCAEDWGAVMKATSAATEAELDLTAPRKLLMAQHTRAQYPDDETDLAWHKPTQAVVIVPT